MQAPRPATYPSCSLPFQFLTSPKAELPLHYQPHCRSRSLSFVHLVAPAASPSFPSHSGSSPLLFTVTPQPVSTTPSRHCSLQLQPFSTPDYHTLCLLRTRCHLSLTLTLSSAHHATAPCLFQQLFNLSSHGQLLHRRHFPRRNSQFPASLPHLAISAVSLHQPISALHLHRRFLSCPHVRRISLSKLAALSLFSRLPSPAASTTCALPSSPHSFASLHFLCHGPAPMHETAAHFSPLSKHLSLCLSHVLSSFFFCFCLQITHTLTCTHVT